MELINLVRVYDAHPPYPENSYLIDRLWPRGISKARLAGVIWLKDAAPSSELRKWYHEHLDEWPIFYLQYTQELENNASAQMLLEKLKQKQSITLLLGSKNHQENHGIVLRDFLLSKLK